MNKSLPPGPINFNAPFGLTWRHYWKLRTDPIRHAIELSNKYGDVAFFRVFWHRMVLINHPDLIHQVLVTESECFPKFDRVRNHLRQATGEGLLVTQGKVWRQQRLETQKTFRSSRMDSFGKLTANHTTAMLTRWRGKSDVQIEHEMTALTQAIMGEGFFGVPLSGSQRIADAVRTLSDIFHEESRALFQLPDWFPSHSIRQKKASIQLLQNTLSSVIQDRLESGERRDDFLDMLLHASGNRSKPDLNPINIDGIRSQLLTMYLAGFHTTSVALAWLMFAVARHEDVQRRLRKEVHQVCGETPPGTQHVDQLKYTQMVVKETLRLYPPSWELFARRSVRDTELGGYRVPAKSLVLIMPILTHRDPRFFPNPMEFDPLRFSPSREHEIPPHAWFPFGAGPHHCIGKSMALMQMTQILAAVIQKFELKLDETEAQEIPVVPKVSLRPAKDIKLLITPRKAELSSTTGLVRDQPSFGIQSQ